LRGTRAEIVPQLDQLRRDPLCRAVVRTDLEQAFLDLESLGDWLKAAGPAGRSGALDRAVMTLRDIEQLCEGVRIEIEGSLQGGKSVFDAADAPSSGISLAISSSACDTVFAAMQLAQNVGTRVALDSNLRLSLWPLARAQACIRQAVGLCDLFLPSLEDMTTLTGLTQAADIIAWSHAQGAAHFGGLRFGHGFGSVVVKPSR
jgi:hypothetical protein